MIVFKSAEHRTRFIDTMQKTGKIYDGNKLDVEYASAIYILTASLNTWNKAGNYVSRNGIQFDRIIKEVDLSSGFYALVSLAANLFNEMFMIDENDDRAIRPNMVDVACNLDEGYFNVAMEAIKIRRCYSLRLDDLKA